MNGMADYLRQLGGQQPQQFEQAPQVGVGRSNFDPSMVSSTGAGGGAMGGLAAALRGGTAYLNAQQNKQPQSGFGQMGQIAGQQAGGSGMAGKVGSVLGGAAGTAFGGPVGGMVGSAIGGAVGPMANDAIKSIFNIFG